MDTVTNFFVSGWTSPDDPRLGYVILAGALLLMLVCVWRLTGLPREGEDR